MLLLPHEEQTRRRVHEVRVRMRGRTPLLLRLIESRMAGGWEESSLRFSDEVEYAPLGCSSALSWASLSLISVILRLCSMNSSVISFSWALDMFWISPMGTVLAIAMFLSVTRSQLHRFLSASTINLGTLRSLKMLMISWDTSLPFGCLALSFRNCLVTVFRLSFAYYRWDSDDRTCDTGYEIWFAAPPLLHQSSYSPDRLTVVSLPPCSVTNEEGGWLAL